MATVSAPNLVQPAGHSISSSSSIQSIKKAFRRSIDEDSGSNRNSIDELSLERSPTLLSTRSSPSRDGSISGHGGIHKLIPGHNKRQRQRAREAELQILEQEPVQRGRSPETTTLPPPGVNRSVSSLLTDGSENDTPPPLISRDSHTGYFTTSSPLISSKTLADGQQRNASDTNLPAATPTEAFPMILEPPQHVQGDVSPRSPRLNFGSTPNLLSPSLTDKADLLHADMATTRKGSMGKLRAKSPAKKIRDAFSRSSRSPRSSPEREPLNHGSISESPDPANKSVAERRFTDNPERGPPTPLKDLDATPRPALSSPTRALALDTEASRPETPPSGRLSTPLTTVTPPTPTEIFREEIFASPKMVNGSDQEFSSTEQKAAAPAGDALTHRRIRSGPSNTHQKSKLSTSMTAPLTPTVEEPNKTPTEKPVGGRNFTANSGFFSSWVSAAQNAASSITNLTGPNRSRAGTGSSDATKARSIEEKERPGTASEDGEVAKKRLAVETLGSGSLDFSQLGLDLNSDDKNMSLGRPQLSGLRKKSDLQRDEAQAKVEDVLAKRAVSAAYEEVGDSTPIAEVSDPVLHIKHSQTFEAPTTGALTPPNGSIHDGDGQPVKRSNSVRSKLGKRRSRGSSVTTGQPAVGALAGSGAITAANPSPGPRVTGFTPAPKQRNRGYHQQFRSVPEDDNLIEDYSCALQKEILLAGRIYISEGHICFSSNILGWVTTLIISFEEIVSIERENTAMIIPNAIAIQTLHARHTFRSLLSREATFDLMIGIWKVNHPASFSKSVNGKQLVAEQARHDAEKALGNKAGDEGESEGSSDERSDSDGDDDDESDRSVAGSSASVADSEVADTKSVTRKSSGTNGLQPTINGTAPAATTGDIALAPAIAAGVTGAVTDFPGPVAHAPTECTDGATHYDKIIKDDIISAPLGKVYSLMYGPQSGVFLRKYLVDECKCLELVLEDDKKGLTNENKSRQYSYIKPLGGSIGPKQTKCITTENIDFFDLEKSVSVTCTTQTPDVPSGNAFSTKTRYCLTWAPGNATRLQMNCTIEWTAKSWLKGPIEKGANDGQQQYGDGLVKALKASLGRSRAATVGSKGAKTKRKKKGDKKSKSEQHSQSAQQQKNWGLLEPLRLTLEPVVNIVGPVARLELIVGILSIMVLVLWFGGSRTGNRQLAYPGSPLSRIERSAAYEQLWQREESDLWDWLEDRAGVNQVMLGGSASDTNSGSGKKNPRAGRQRSLRDKSMAARLHAEKWSKKEMQEAVRVTRERLNEMQRALDEKTV